MYKKINILLLMIFLFSIIPLVSSAPPFQTQQSLTGVDIAGVDFSAIKTSTSRTAVANVFNSTSGLPLLSGVSCQFQVFSVADTGSLIFTNSTPTIIGNTFYFGIPNTVYNKTSEYTRIIQCNTSLVGGFYKSSFFATPNGFITDTGRSLIDVGLLLMLIVFIVIAMYIFVRFDNLLVRVGMFGLTYLLLIAITFISWNMANDFLFSAPFITDMFRILFIVLVVGAFPLLIGAFVWYLIMLFKIKEIERLMTKGFSEDEARRRSSR